MTDLDLDALGNWTRKLALQTDPDWQEVGRIIDTLIQRLQETETQSKTDWAWHALQKAEQRIAQLERVREAAIELADAADRHWVHGETLDAAIVASGKLRAALAAVEDK